MKMLTGDTFTHRSLIKSKGGKWNGKYWFVPENVFDELNDLCLKNFKTRRFECCDCGDDVYQGSQCWETGLIH